MPTRDAFGPHVTVLAWSVARTVESALWHASEGRIDAGSADVAEATVLARLLTG